MEKKTIGSFIAALRKANGLTQKQLAEKLNVSDKAVSRWERDEAMPDLSMIPELAEIFGVTTDEILRGQRFNPEITPQPSGEKSEKQRKRLLADRKTKYAIRSCVCIGLSVLGLIGAMICNFGFLRAYIGFMVGCVFFVAAVICQIGFIFADLSGLDEEMVTPAELVAHREHTVKLACGSFGTTLVLLAACIPLIVFPWDTYQGLEAGSWLGYGLLFGAIGFGVYLVAACAVKWSLTKNALIYTGEKPKARQALKVRFVRLGVLVFAGLFIGQLVLVSCLPDLLKQGVRFDDWDSFKAFMETPVSEEEYVDYGFGSVSVDIAPTDEVPLPDREYFDEFGNSIDEPMQQILGEDGTVLCQYYHRNQSISSWTYSVSDPDDPRITVYTTSEMRRVDSLMEDNILPAYCLLYPLSALVLYYFYRKNAKKL